MHAGTADQGDRRDGYSFVDDRDPVFAADLLAGGDEPLREAADLFADFVRRALHVVRDTVEEADAHGNRADVEILLVDHFVCFVDFK